MKLIVRTPVSQRRVMADGPEDLDAAIREAFKVERFSLFQDAERTKPLDRKALADGLVIFMDYEMKEPRIHKEVMKCTHSPEAVCPACATLDPFDRRRTEGMKTKYLSYRSYLEMLKQRGTAEDRFDYSVVECDDHPRNVTCMKCMEKAITLAPQIYRRVDYVEFDNRQCLEAFIGRWRSSGRQRLGFLVGRVVDHEAVPGGRRAVVSGIWEVEQENYPDGAVLQCIPKRFIYDGLALVGLVYTDLWLRDGVQFSYKQKLGHVVSAMELNFFYEVQSAVHAQEFVHVCVTSDAEHNIAPEAFMLTQQFVGLMNARLLQLTTDPALFETERDMSYLIRNEYNRDVPTQAKPFVPVDYFVVDCGIGYREDPLFPDRTVLEKCTLRELARHFAGDYSFAKFGSFSVLVALHRHTACAAEIFQAVLDRDEAAFRRVAEGADFKDLCMRLGELDVAEWSCGACTYLNCAQAVQCEMCQQPR